MDLVVLAAGVGGRFGGDKQLAAVGPGGETLLDYTLFDAARAGFGRAVVVVRPEMDPDFARDLAARWRGRIEIEIVHQSLAQPPPGLGGPSSRRKPWGTAHAVLAAEAAVAEAAVAEGAVAEGTVGDAFAVVNADDCYGAAAFEVAAELLRAGLDDRCAPPVWALVAYRLGDTLSAAGPVNRALCRVDEAGWLLDLEERAFDRDELEREGVERARDALVSMNFWCFDRSVFGLLRRGFAAFSAHADLERDEYRLPDAVQAILAVGEARVRVVRSLGRWFGLTHPQDRDAVSAELRRLVGEGRYPARLAGGMADG